MGIWTRFLGGSSKVEHRALIPAVDGSNPSLPIISRRSFLVGAAASAVVAPTIARTFFGPPRGGWPVADFNTDVMRYKAYERYSVGWTDPKAIYGTLYGCEPCKPSIASEFSRLAEPGARKFWNGVYDSRCQEYEALYGGAGVSLKSIPHPGSEFLNEEDRGFIEEGGWKCLNGHPYCNRCASPVELNEASLEKMLIDIKEQVDPRKPRLDPTKAWYLSPESSEGLKRFGRKSPIPISPGKRRWWE